MTRRTLPLALAALALAAAACAGDAPDGAATGTSTSAEATEAAPTAADGEVVRCSSFATDCEESLPPGTVELRGIMFRPGELTVAAGTTVTFENLDEVDHTVTAGTPEAPEPDRFDVTLATAGDSTEITLDDPGTIAYFCRVHPSMTGTLVVE